MAVVVGALQYRRMCRKKDVNIVFHELESVELQVRIANFLCNLEGSFLKVNRVSTKRQSRTMEKVSTRKPGLKCVDVRTGP
jgi:hypothetical protein